MDELEIKDSRLSNKQREEIDKQIWEGIRKRPGSNSFGHKITMLLISSMVRSASGTGGVIGYSSKKMAHPLMPFWREGSQMEADADLMASLTAELKESKKTLETLFNDLTALHDQIQPKLSEQIKRVRESRMTVVREMTETLVCLRDVRKFFLEADYKTEIERLERFVRLLRDLQGLKTEGVLDAVADSMMRLMLRQEEK